MNLPNKITMARIIMIPFFIIAMLVDFPGHQPLAVALFIIAAVSDSVDGHIARSRNLITHFGKCMDPVADKLMVAAALIMLVQLDRTNAVIATIIIGREITISALREWMAKIGASKSVAVSMIGKIKTTAQMSAIPLLLYQAPVAGYDIRQAGTWLIYVAAVLTLWSMGYYMRMAWPQIALHKDN